MQRMHVGLKVSNIGEAVAFYSKLFGAEPISSARIMRSGCWTTRS